MNQLINLYQPILRAQPKIFSVRTMLQILALVLAGLVALYFYARLQGQNLDEQLRTLQSQRDTYMQRIETFNKEFPVKVKSAQLEAEVTRLTAELAAKRHALKILAGGVHGNIEGFSPHFTSLARQRLPGLWLTGIAIREGGTALDLRGSTLQPELVPRFLQQLGQEAPFSGREFETFQMARAENNLARIDFLLNTRATTTETTP